MSTSTSSQLSLAPKSRFYLFLSLTTHTTTATELYLYSTYCAHFLARKFFRSVRALAHNNFYLFHLVIVSMFSFHPIPISSVHCIPACVLPHHPHHFCTRLLIIFLSLFLLVSRFSPNSTSQLDGASLSETAKVPTLSPGHYQDMQPALLVTNTVRLVGVRLYCLTRTAVEVAAISPNPRTLARRILPAEVSLIWRTVSPPQCVTPGAHQTGGQGFWG